MRKTNSEPKVKRAKVKKVKTHSTAKSLTAIISALIITMAIFTGLIYLNNYISEDVAYKDVVVAKNNIPENLYVTQENASDYFTIESVDIRALPKDSLSSLTDYLGRYISYDISEKEVITEKDFKELSTDEFENPVEVSLMVDNLGNAVCGKLRAGDVINIILNIKANSNITNETKVYNNVLVTRVFDSQCKEILANDKVSNTTYIIFNLEKNEEKELNEALISCSSIRVSRILE